MDTLQVTVPSDPLPWWTTSNISEWRNLVDFGGIKDTDPQDISIFDWKIIFEIALRHPASIWRLSPSITLGGEAVPIIGRVQEADFVSGRVIFRLYPPTAELLLKHHAEFIRQQRIPPRRALEILHTFQRRLDVLQVKFHAGVLTCTDGLFARGDFPAYASTSGSNKQIVRMLGLALKETGLRKTLLDAFFDISPKVPPFLFARLSASIGAGAYEPRTISPSLISPSTDSSFVTDSSDDSTSSPVHGSKFPSSELQSYSSREGPARQVGVHLPASDRTSASSPARSRKRRTSSTLSFDTIQKRRRANIVENQHGGKGRRPSAQNSLRILAVTSSPSVRSGHTVHYRRPLSVLSSPQTGGLVERRRSYAQPTSSPLSVCPSERYGTPRSLSHTSNSIKAPPSSPATSLASRHWEFDVNPCLASPEALSSPAIYPINDNLKQDELVTFKLESSPFTPTARRHAVLSKPLNLTIISNRATEESEKPAYYSDNNEGNEENISPKADTPYRRPISTVKEDVSTPGKKIKAVSARASAMTVARYRKYRDMEDFTDTEDLILDTDTPDLELLTDSADEDDHRDRKERRRQRKSEKKEHDNTSK